MSGEMEVAMKRITVRFMTMLLPVFLAWFVFMTAAYAETPAEPEGPVAATVGKDGVQRLDIEVGSYYFKPNHIIVKVDVPVELTLTKEAGITPHDFTIDAADAGMEIKKNLGSKPVIVRFTPTKTGNYIFYCSKRFLFFASHRERGMEGTIEVVP